MARSKGTRTLQSIIHAPAHELAQYSATTQQRIDITYLDAGNVIQPMVSFVSSEMGMYSKHESTNIRKSLTLTLTLLTLTLTLARYTPDKTKDGTQRQSIHHEDKNEDKGNP